MGLAAAVGTHFWGHATHVWKDGIRKNCYFHRSSYTGACPLARFQISHIALQRNSELSSKWMGKWQAIRVDDHADQAESSARQLCSMRLAPVPGR